MTGKTFIETFAESCRALINSFAKALYELFRTIAKATLEEIRKIATLYKQFKATQEKNERKRKLKQAWITPSKITKPHQVTSRKPLFAKARSNC